MTILQAFWAKINKRTAFWLAVPLVLIVVAEITTTALIPQARKIIIDSLEAFDHSWFLIAALIAFTNSLILIGAQGMKEWTSQKLSFLGREALMKTIKKKWIQNDGRTNLSNPCARLNDDSRMATELALKVGVEVLISTSIVVALLFTIIKWPLLLGAAVMYSGLSIMIATLFRRPMINSRYQLSNTEGQHRIALTKISMQQGDYTSKSRWIALKESYHAYIAICRNYKLFNAGQSALMFTLPFLIMAPDFFAHRISLGDIVQGTTTFDLLVLNATIWVQLYPAITEAQTAFIRVKEFYDETNQ